MTCKKQRVICVITLGNGGFVIGENDCLSPQDVCPREGMKTGEGYHLCAEVCRQRGHAEKMAIEKVPEEETAISAYIFGHSYVCKSCEAALNEAGVKRIVIPGGSQ